MYYIYIYNNDIRYNNCNNSLYIYITIISRAEIVLEYTEKHSSPLTSIYSKHSQLLKHSRKTLNRIFLIYIL